MTSGEHAHARRTMWVHVALLALLCVLCFFPGLDSHGVTNWQEGQRLLVARDMQARGDWLVPTVHGEPYIAKPPMIYWAQLAVAGVLGETVELWHLRFVVAMAGLLGVLATYGAARQLLLADRATREERARAARGAAWAAALLATGILYVRAARIGELDILIVPFVAAAVWGVACAFRTHRLSRRTNWLAVLVAVVAASGAVLTKDPGPMFVAFAAYGGIAVWYAHTPEPLDVAMFPRGTGGGIVEAPTAPRWLPLVGGAVVGGGFFAAMARNVTSAGEALGPVLIGIAGAWLGATIARLLQPRRLRAFVVALSRTHPLLVLGVPVGVAVGWRWLVAQRVGDGVVESLAKGEVDDNVRPFIAAAPINNVETVLFGLGIGSVLAIVGCVVLLRLRPRLTPGGAMIAAWIVLSLIAMSVLGKGVQRYLTPMWPAWAMVAAWMAARWTEPRPMRVAVGPWLVATVVVLAAGQSVQYGWLRDQLNAKRSPRDLLQELSLRLGDEELSRVYLYEYASPAMDYYAGRRVQIVGDPRALATMYAGDAWTLGQFRAHLVESGPAVLIYRDGLIPGVGGVGLAPADERLREAGFVVESLGTLPAFEIDNGRTPMKAARVSTGSGAGSR